VSRIRASSGRGFSVSTGPWAMATSSGIAEVSTAGRPQSQIYLIVGEILSLLFESGLVIIVVVGRFRLPRNSPRMALPPQRSPSRKVGCAGRRRRAITPNAIVTAATSPPAAPRSPARGVTPSIPQRSIVSSCVFDTGSQSCVPPRAARARIHHAVFHVSGLALTTRHSRSLLAAAALLCALPCAAAPPRTPASGGLGTIRFPNSGAPAAQTAFVEGVKALHSFEFDQAALFFQEAQRGDPGFALAYGGEAMSSNHPTWAEVDAAAARSALGRLSPTAEGRRARAKTEKEKAFLDAADVLFSDGGDKLARDLAYSHAMEAMYARWPDDHEVATFYALSLLGTVRPGDVGFRRQALAASIAERGLQENPNHPGAAHFVIHAFDDPDHAPLALDAARSYARIAPRAPHALHMPSHIFVQLGLWEDTIESNAVAYRAAVEQIARLGTREGREDFHTLSWLIYAELMMGRIDEARANLDRARETALRHPDDPAIHAYYLGIRALYVMETGQWDALRSAEPTADAADSPHAGMPGMAGRGVGYNGAVMWTFVSGMAGAKTGDFAAAAAAEGRPPELGARAEAGGDGSAARALSRVGREVGGRTRRWRGA